MMKKVVLLCCCLVLVLLSGCSNLGFLQYSNSTSVNLSGNNYRVLETNIRGESDGFTLLSFIPIVSPSYADAMSNLHQNVKMEGKATALANVAHDSGCLNLILFSFPRIVITADIVEFVDGPLQK